MTHIPADFLKVFGDVHRPRLRAAWELREEGKPVTREAIERRLEQRGRAQ